MHASLQGGAETEAVVKQIEGLMTEEQLAAIEAMDLSREDLETWMGEQGIEMAAAPGGQRAGALGGMSEDERAKLRGELQNMTDEQRATRMAELGPSWSSSCPRARPSSSSTEMHPVGQTLAQAEQLRQLSLGSSKGKATRRPKPRPM